MAPIKKLQRRKNSFHVISEQVSEKKNDRMPPGIHRVRPRTITDVNAITFAALVPCAYLS